MTPAGSQSSMRPLRQAFPQALPALSSIPEVLWKPSYFSKNGKLLVLKIGEQQKSLISQFQRYHNQKIVESSENTKEKSTSEEVTKTSINDSEIKSEYNSPSYQDKIISVKVPFLSILSTYVGVGFIIILFGNIQDFVRKFFNKYRSGEHKCPDDIKDFPDIYGQGYDTFIRRNFYNRCRDNFNRPIIGCPGALVSIQNRISVSKNWFMKFLGIIQNLS